MARLFSSVLGRRFCSILLAAPLAAAGLTVSGVVSAPSAAALPPPIGFNSVTPFRAVDTRNTPFGPLPLLAGESRRVRIAGLGGVPASAFAVALNVTVVDPGGDGYLTVHASNVPQPLASNLNFVYSQNVANMVTTAFGPDGDIAIFNGANGTAHVIVDIAGWYAAGFIPITPTRILDTRPSGPLAAGSERSLVISGQAGVPPTARAVVLNVTSVNAGSPGYLTVYPTGVPRPNASNLNYIPGLVVPAMVTVGLGTDGSIQMFSGDGGTDLVVDVAGWFESGFQPLTPARIMDTRAGSCGTRIGPGETRYVQVAGRGGVPAEVGAVNLTVTAVNPTEPTYLTVWPADQPKPTASNLNTIGGIVPNLVTTGLSPNGRVAVFNAAGTTELLIDVAGWYDGPGPAVGTTAGCQTAGLAAGVTAQHPAPSVDNVGMSGVVLAPLRFGQSGPLVSNLQARLYSLGYWVADFDGSYGVVTSQAVMAFQKYNGLPRTGNFGAREAYLLTMQSYKPTGRNGGQGDRFEVDKGRQLLFVIRGGKTVMVVNTSTGSDIPYTEENQKDGGPISGDAHTPVGRFRVGRVYSDGWESGQLGELYRPRYFNGGIAVHGAPSIPGYPASHGCVRVTTTFMDWVWHVNLMPVGSEVWVHE